MKPNTAKQFSYACNKDLQTLSNPHIKLHHLLVQYYHNQRKIALSEKVQAYLSATNEAEAFAALKTILNETLSLKRIHDGKTDLTPALAAELKTLWAEVIHNDAAVL